MIPRRRALAPWALLAASTLLLVRSPAGSQEPARLTAGVATGFAELALHCVATEYPNKPGHLLESPEDLWGPRALHPAFYGCFDWHSSVHGHWMLAHLLRRFPELEAGETIRGALDRSLTRANLLREAAYLAEPQHRSFERMYGWSWLLKLAEELHWWDDDDAQRWARNLQPLTQIVVERYLDFLPRQTYPIRVGTHTNTAFGMTFAWDFAQATSHAELARLLEKRARDYFAQDAGCPVAWEPGGADFLSPCLEEAELMARVLPRQDFAAWLDNFLPEIAAGGLAALRQPAVVSDRTDPQIVHLDGLNLSRAWAFRRVARALAEGDNRRAVLEGAAREHLAATLPHVASGNYEGEHWLASFAVWALAQD